VAKPLKFYQTLNQAPRSPQHGKHRRARPSVHGRTFIGADHSARGSDEDRTVTISWSSLGTVTWDTTVAVEPVKPKPPAIPYAGIRTGEIIGHRLWWVIADAIHGLSLSSIAHRRRWLPDETISGNTDEPAHTYCFPPIWGGVYAFASLDSLRKEVDAVAAGWVKYKIAIANGYFPMIWEWNPFHEALAFVSGTVKMWGDVVEHETGYRAQFAKLHSLDAIYGDGDLDALRAKYGVNTLPANQKRTSA
jgi:hypothetical protein